MATNFIPNSFQHPNAYVDKYMSFLTNNELRVLLYMMRRIFGFQKRQDNIALSQIVGGLITSQGERLDYGAGLSKPAAIKAIDGLKQYRLVVEVADNDPATNAGKCYALELDDDRVDFAGLLERKGVLRRLETERTQKGRDAIKVKREEEVNEIYQQERGQCDLPGEVNEIYRARSMPLTHKVSEETQLEKHPHIEKPNNGFSRVSPEHPQAQQPSLSLDGLSVPDAENENDSQHEKAKKPRTKKAPTGNPNTQPILSAYQQAYEEHTGFSYTFPGFDKKAAKTLADAGYTPDQVVTAYKYLCSDSWWSQRNNISLVNVSTEIGGILKKLGYSPSRDGSSVQSQPPKPNYLTFENTYT